MITYPDIDPVIFSIGPLKVRWYGLMYVLGFAATYVLVRYQARKYNLHKLEQTFENLNIALIFSLIVGARVGYALFYNFSYYADNPMAIIAIWQGGMSFHGAFLGLVFGGLLYCRKVGLPFMQTADIYIVTIPIGLGLGRIGNFINGELFGRVTDVPWAMIFPAGGPLPRHPSQLYEFLLEGVVLFTLLWLLKDVKRRRHWPDGTMLALFLVFYGIMRTFVELFREPDVQLGLFFSLLSMGQILSTLMIIAGCGLLYILLRRPPVPEA